ncbi:hypothetical protein ACOMHN_063743 [Nucella lapillus]
MDTDKDAAGDRMPSFVWKEPINGKMAFFTEEVYQQLAGPEPSLEDRVMKMMDALGFPPPPPAFKTNNSNISRRFDSQGAKQRSMEESCSQDSFTAATSAPHKVKNQDAASCSQQALVSETKEDSVGKCVPTETSASLESPMSPPSQEDTPNVEQEHHTAHCVPQSSHTKVTSSDPAMTSAGASLSDMDVVGMETEISDPKRPREQQEQGKDRRQAAVDPVLHPWTDSQQKDNSVSDSVKAQTRYSAHRSKAHDKMRRPPVPEARKSSLTHEQHIRYMYLFKKFSQRFISGFCNPPTPSERVELQEFEGLQLQVAQEQEECQNYLQQTALLNPYLYTNLPSHLNQYTKEKEESAWKRAESYCRYYGPASQVPLMMDLQQPPSLAAPAMTFTQTLLELGSKCKVVMPDSNPNPNARIRRTVCTELQKVSARFPPVYPSTQHTWNHEPASKDNNLEGLVRKYSCHIATSASVLHQLIDNHAPEFGVAWDIPVVVREYGSGATSKKVVFLDKPLLPKRRSACEKKVQYLRKAVRAYICQPLNERKFLGGRRRNAKEALPVERMDAGEGNRALGRVLSTKTEDDDDPFGSVSMEDLETFGSDRLVSNTNRKVGDPKSWQGKQRGMTTALAHMSGCFASEGLGAETSGLVSKTDVQDKQESTQTSESESHRDGVTAGHESEPKQDSEESGSQNTAQTDTISPMNSPTRSCPRGSGMREPEPSSDSDMDALVIADMCSPDRGTGNPGASTQHALRRKTLPSKPSIFDGVPATAPDSCLEQTQTGIQSPRRITRSVSQKLHSPTLGVEEGKRSTSVDGSGVPGSSQADVSSSPVGLAAGESVAAAAVVSPSPRTTRQSVKRKMSESALSSEQDSVGEEPAGTEKGRKEGGQMERSTAAATSAVVSGTEEDSQGTEDDAGMGQEDGGSTLGKSAAEKAEQEKPSSSAAPSYLDSLLTEMTPSGNSTKIKFQEDPRQYIHPGGAGDHVSYHLWHLTGTALIMRCNSHAFVRDLRQQEKPVYVSAKPERQVPHGLEQNTMSECVGGWLGCYLRPNSYLLRARVNMQNYEVVHTEELQLNQILHPALNFSPHHAFAVLNNIFTKLTELPVGSHLLSHEAGANHVLLRSGTGTRRGSCDLRSRYMGLLMQEGDRGVSWVPVDPTPILPHHWRLGLIPVTFQPPDYDPKRKKQQFAAPKKKQRNKKKHI